MLKRVPESLKKLPQCNIGRGRRGRSSDAQPTDYQNEFRPPAQTQPTSARISDPNRARFQRPQRRGGRPQPAAAVRTRIIAASRSAARR